MNSTQWVVAEMWFMVNSFLYCYSLGAIRMDSLCRTLISTPEFQRLKDIKQLDHLYLMFKNATHTRWKRCLSLRNRYEHCIGTSYLCGKYYDELIKHSNQPLGMNEEEIGQYRRCVVIAGLLHDIGHCVLGHSYPTYVKNCTNKEPIEHETMGILIFQRLLEREDISRVFHSRKLDAEASAKDGCHLSYIDYICMMIAGKKKLLPKEMEGKWDAIPNDKKWLFQIVSNEGLSLHQQLIPRNGIDMDRVDYLLRDSKYVLLRAKYHVDGDKGVSEL